jgi:hypothetical protein
VLEGFDKEKDYKDQDDELYDIWEREWDVYSMVVDYYEKYPDENVRLCWNRLMWEVMMKVIQERGNNNCWGGGRIYC